MDTAVNPIKKERDVAVPEARIQARIKFQGNN